MLGCAFQDLERPADAMRAYRAALQADQAHARAANNLGCLQEEAGELAGALESYDRALAADPDLANAPAYPALLAGAMRVLPFDFKFPKEDQFRTWQPEQLIAWVNQALFLLAVVLAWRLARNLFDPTVAWLSAAVILGADLLWRFSISGLSTMLALALLMLVAAFGGRELILEAYREAVRREFRFYSYGDAMLVV